MRLVISLGPMADKKIFTRLLYIYTPAAFLFPTLPVWFMEVGVGYFKQREHPFSFGAIELSLTVTLLKKVLYYEHLGLLTLSSLFIFVANGIVDGRSKKVEINDHARKRLQKLFYLSTFAITIPHLFRIILKVRKQNRLQFYTSETQVASMNWSSVSIVSGSLISDIGCFSTLIIFSLFYVKPTQIHVTPASIPLPTISQLPHV
ncbi:Protein CBG27729 [Caenorhabditis briggsae]|uniref:Protein CBG27729 n=1 Tax=Caenorhabditis briggsae TaxID=6238 RepID=B6IJ27_CAEBR|nr:Protein CBG27729 [Caenorhabditis briggsae]CAS00007.1 Protein CBG27729 [Caenorhabditis briggsae]